MSGSSGLAATLPMGKPHDGQNLCASSHSLAHWGHVRMQRSGQHPAARGSSEATTTAAAIRTRAAAGARWAAAPSRQAREAEIWLPGGPVSYDAAVAKRIGELLVEGGILSQSQLEQALFAQRKDGRKLGQLLVELGFVTEIQVTQTLSRQL